MENTNIDLLLLEDYELIAAVRNGIFEEIQNLPSDDALENIPPIKFFLITASIFDLEMQNGGLCQFLMNAGRVHGPVLEEALCAFGAEQHARITLDFCEKNNIDLSDLQEFAPVSVENYIRLARKYPFGDFDKPYFALDRECPLERILGKYLRDNISQFQRL